MPSTPVMHHLRTTNPKPAGDLMRTHKIVHIDPVAHSQRR